MNCRTEGSWLNSITQSNPMKKIKIKLQYCHGIKKMECTFDLKQRVACIYAPNGVMKTSFAKTFNDVQEGIETNDNLFPDRKSVRIIETSEGKSIESEEVFVVDPYKEDFQSEKLSTLLVNQQLKEKYDEVHRTIDDTTTALLKELAKISGVKTELSDEISVAFTNDYDKLYIALERIEKEVLDDTEPEFGKVNYKIIFNDKVIAFLETKDFKKQLSQYIEKYDELLKASKYFRKGIFNHNNASTIAKNLAENGFFQANHLVYLNSNENKKQEVSTQQELEDIIEREKLSILTNKELVSTFNEIDAKLKANKELRDFREHIITNLTLIPELANLSSFKQKLWISYLKQRKEMFRELISSYRAGKDQLSSIIKQAKNEKTNWIKVIDIFNKRFVVPFSLTVENQDDVILKSEVPSIRFIFKDNDGEATVEKSDLLQVLSNGEKRALYLLNIIFEVEARKNAKQRTLFVIDDIADSFDYKNKYAIIEYLKNIAEEEFFYQIVLTHNFDFFRTIQSRYINRNYSHMINKTHESIELINAEYLKPFSYFKDTFHLNDAVFIATIPFVRNLIEYTKDISDENFIKLTSLLHVKEDTYQIGTDDIMHIFNEVLHKSVKRRGSKKVVELLFLLSEQLIKETNHKVSLENKIVLSIAIRLKAEQYMIDKISDQKKIKAIEKNQTAELFTILRQMKKVDSQTLEILDQVNLMTPENIHFNSFMYEPILDMSDDHLKSLYKSVIALV